MMTLSWIVYGSVLFVIFWGFRFAGFKDNFNEDFSSLKITRSLRGLCALCILVHHFSIQLPFRYAGEFKLFYGMGIFFVSVFFFYSGYGLLKSIDTKQGYLENFLKTRILKSLVVPFYVNSVIYGIFYAAMGYSLPFYKWIGGFMGLFLFNEYAWYPIVLVILYLLFYVLFYNLRHRDDAFFFIFLVIFVLASVFCISGHYPFVKKVLGWNYCVNEWTGEKWWDTSKQLWFCGEWWVNTLIAFPAGMIFEDNEKKIVEWLKRFYWLKLLAVISLFVLMNFIANETMNFHNYWSELETGENLVYDRFICFTVQQPLVLLFMLMVIQIMMKFESINPVTQFFGHFSLEVYLMNLMVIRFFSFMIFNENNTVRIDSNRMNLVVYFLCVLFFTILSGMVFKFFCHKINLLLSWINNRFYTEL